MRVVSVAGCVWITSCVPAASSSPAAPAAPCASSPVQSASAPAVAAPPPSAEPEKIAVLPFDDDELFRDERRALRAKLASRLAAQLPSHRVLPLSEVDAKLSPLSKSGARCAFAHEPATRRAGAQGWLTTELIHVSGFENSPEQLWVQLNGAQSVELTLGATWNPKLDRIARYESAFGALQRLPHAGLLGGLAGRFTPRGEVTVGSLTLCQRHGFRDCVPETRAFTDRAEELSACFAGADDERRYLLFEGARRCEFENLDDASGRDGQREACLCAALKRSAGANASSGRWRLALHYEAKDLMGKPRPELRVVEASTNLHAEDDWHSMQRDEAGKNTYSSVRRLSVDNIDAVSPALARCTFAAGSVVVADLTLGEAGTVEKARVIGGSSSKAGSTCIEKALVRGAFACTSDGKPATLRVAITAPGQ